jgi:hypothetical protein
MAHFSETRITREWCRASAGWTMKALVNVDSAEAMGRQTSDVMVMHVRIF